MAGLSVGCGKKNLKKAGVISVSVQAYGKVGGGGGCKVGGKVGCKVGGGGC